MKPKIQLIVMPQCIEQMRKHGNEVIDHPDATIELVWRDPRRPWWARLFRRAATPNPHLHFFSAQGPGAYFIVATSDERAAATRGVKAAQPRSATNGAAAALSGEEDTRG